MKTFFVIVACLCTAASSVRAEETLRIAVAKVQSELVISGPDLVVVDPASNQTIHRGSPIKFAPSERGIIAAGELVATTKLHVASRGSLTVRNLTLEGLVEVHQEMRRGRAQLLVVHSVPIESYVVATVASEMPTSWPMEALKAQSVATRTFAVFRKFHAPDRPYHMEAGVIDQVYGGAAKMHPRCKKATRATRGEVLTYHRRPIRAYFHSCCAGKTESAKEGWGQNLPYLPGSVCPYDTACPAQHYVARIKLSKLLTALRSARIRVKEIKGVSIKQHTSTGRVSKLVLATDGGKVDLSGEDLRRLVGYNLVKSRTFTAKIEGSELVVEGKGSGHGVGMCQWGAKGMSDKRFGYKKILKHYYPGTKLLKMY